jgi:hypothetical protein
MGVDHHTKVKGDYAVLRTAAELGRSGVLVCNPMTEHAPFDLVGYVQEAFVRVQVKYRTAVRGVVDIRLRSTWADRNGLHVRQNQGEIDLVSVYEPGLDRCLWLSPLDIGLSISIRTSPASNGQQRRVHPAEDYFDLDAALAAVVDG